jgi:hypothetical protein
VCACVRVCVCGAGRFVHRNIEHAIVTAHTHVWITSNTRSSLRTRTCGSTHLKANVLAEGECHVLVAHDAVVVELLMNAEAERELCFT